MRLKLNGYYVIADRRGNTFPDTISKTFRESISRMLKSSSVTWPSFKRRTGCRWVKVHVIIMPIAPGKRRKRVSYGNNE